MDLTIAANSAAAGSGDTAPTTGTPGDFTSGNPSANPLVPATVVPAYFLNMIQYEIRNAIVGLSSLTPAGSVWTQLRDAIKAYVAGAYKGAPTEIQALRTTSSFTVPAGVTMVSLRIWGGGGGGGAGGSNTASAVSSGGGGGAGAYIKIAVPVVQGNVVGFTVGTGGTGGVANGASGLSGGDTILYLSGVEIARAKGGTGAANATSGNVGMGGAGGAWTIANGYMYEAYNGDGGSYGTYVSGTQGFGGNGAAGHCFGSVTTSGTNSQGQSATNPACGGAGGTGSSNGGGGGAGQAIYEW